MLSLHYDRLACQALINNSIDYQLPIFTLNYSFAGIFHQVLQI